MGKQASQPTPPHHSFADTAAAQATDAAEPNLQGSDVVLKLRLPGSADAEKQPSQQQLSSIYDIHSKTRRNVILFTAALGTMVVPCTDTIYLPALDAVAQDLRADSGLVAASVAIYMFLVGIGTLLWGPFADKFGRRTMYMVGMVLFLGTSLGCLFAPSIAVLVAFRGLQGFAVAHFIVIGQGVLADIFPPEIRGTAQGMLNIPLLVGPIIGPLLGGVLSQHYGWRSTFICLVVFVGAIVLPLILLVVPETLQYHVVRRLSRHDLTVLSTMKEAQDILSARPRLTGPWVPLTYLLERQIAPYALLSTTCFACMFASLTEWPGQVSQPPYSLNEGMVGVSYLAMGIAGFFGSPIGGILSDVTAARWPHVPAARLIPATCSALFVMTAGCVMYGWTLAFKTPLVGPLVSHAVIGVASAAVLPGVFGYVSTVKQANASAASAGITCAMFVLAGVLILVSAYAVQAMGIGPFFTLLAGVQLLVALISAACIARGFAAAGRAPDATMDVPSTPDDEEAASKRAAADA